jgi:hypothetical protein
MLYTLIKGARYFAEKLDRYHSQHRNIDETGASMDIVEQIKQYAGEAGAELKEKKGAWTLKLVVAERKAFLSKKKLEYIAKFRVDEDGRTLRFSERLKETGSGISSGGSDFDMSPGFGFRKESYKTGAGPREGTIKEQSDLFGKKYEYTFDFSEIRGWFERLAADYDHSFEYKITPSGI